MAAYELPNGEYKLPNAMNMNELIAEGKSPEQANKIMHERVFGVGFQRNDKGQPIEQGKGSAAQPTPQHTEALRLTEARKMQKEGGGATSEVIAAAVAAGVKAGLAAAREEQL